MIVGSQLFINSDESPERIRSWVDGMAEAGLRRIRLFMVWDQIEAREGQWTFENYDACFDQAQRVGLDVVPTLMAVAPPGWMGLTGGIQSIGPIEDPHLWARGLRYVDIVVERYHQHPALHSWILWNEPDYQPPKNDHTLPDFRRFMEELYNGEVTAMNRHRYMDLDSFEALSFSTEGRSELAFSSHAEKVDWIRYCEHFLLNKLSDLARRVRSIDTEHPIHLNPHNLGICTLFAGQTPWRENDIVDFLGCSAHPPWHSTRFGPERLPHSIAFFSDLIRGASPQCHWVSELQGGMTLYSADHSSCPTPADLTLWLTESLASGAACTLFWCFNARNDGFEAGEWSLLGPFDRSTPRLEAVTRLCHFLKAEKDFFDQLCAPRVNAWILVSEDTLRLASVEGRGELGLRNQHAAMDAVSGAYFALSDLGYQVGFMDERQLATSHPSGDLLVLPNTMVLSSSSIDALKRWNTEGVRLVADGWTAAKDPWGKMNDQHLLNIEELFAAEVHDIEGLSDGGTILSEPHEAPAQWVRYSLAGGEPLAFHEDGRIAVVENRSGGGTLRIGTHVFSTYLEHGDRWKDLLRKWLSPPRELNCQGGEIAIKRLPGKKEDLVILMNRGQERGEASLPSSFTSLGFADAPDHVNGSITLEPKAVAFFKTPCEE